MSKRVVAVIDWSSSAALKENIRFFQLADNGGKVRPREWRASSETFRSLALRADGSCDLQRFSTAVAARRLGWSIAKKTARKARKEQRG